MILEKENHTNLKYRGAKNILEGDLQNHWLKPQDINAVVPELYARDPFFGRIFRGIKKAVGTVRKYIGTATKVAGTAGKMSAQFPKLSVILF